MIMSIDQSFKILSYYVDKGTKEVSFVDILVVSYQIVFQFVPHFLFPPNRVDQYPLSMPD